MVCSGGAVKLYLASASPRRLALLRQIGLRPEVVPAGIEEHAQPHETPHDLVRRLAEAKGRVALARLARRAPAGVVLAADTTVVVAGSVLGKPADPAEASVMLAELRGRTHEVLTGVFLARTDDGRATTGVETTRVRFRKYDDATIREYVASGEPLDKAGAYGLQGRGAELTERIHGSWSNVVGLPLERLPEWLARLDGALRSLA
jgi:septum formation protein